MDSQKTVCLALGMGAIGKAVSGYAMTKAGIHVTYADIATEQIDAVNTAGGYWLGTADIYSKKLTKEFITNVDALHVDSQEVQNVVNNASYMISAVGPKGFRALLHKVSGWLKQRNEVTEEPLYYMVFENDSEAVPLFKEEIVQTFGTWPEWLHVAKCSIERMTKVIQLPDVGAIAVGETFFPIIADGKPMQGSGIYGKSEIVDCVDDINKYYYRKLLTNNLGHAVLGYAGHTKGYKNTVEAIKDPEIYELLKGTLEESAKVVCRKWGFAEEEMKKHIQTLMLRYENPEFADELDRLSRDPFRKISPEERIVFPIKLSYQYGFKPEKLLETLLYAITYSNPNVERGEELIKLRENIGIEEILRTICKAEPEFVQDVMKIKENKF